MDKHKRLTNAIMEALAAAGEFPEGTIQGRLVGHLIEARGLVDQMIGTAPNGPRVMESRMGSSMS